MSNEVQIRQASIDLMQMLKSHQATQIHDIVKGVHAKSPTSEK